MEPAVHLSAYCGMSLEGGRQVVYYSFDCHIVVIDRSSRLGAIVGRKKSLFFLSIYKVRVRFCCIAWGISVSQNCGTKTYCHLIITPRMWNSTKHCSLPAAAPCISPLRTSPAAAHLSICRVAPSSRRDCAPSGAPLRRSSNGPTGRSLHRQKDRQTSRNEPESLFRNCGRIKHM